MGAINHQPIAPTCPKCGHAATMPTRMGMSLPNCKCDACGAAFSFGHTLVIGTTGSSGKTVFESMKAIYGQTVRRAPETGPKPYYRRFERRR